MKLPHAEKAVVPKRKLTDYLLSASHPVGRFKAAFFASFGFSIDGWERLAHAFVQHARANDVESTEDTPFGVRYNVVGPLETPDGRRPVVLVAWFVEKVEAVPRLVTAYPGRRREDR